MSELRTRDPARDPRALRRGQPYDEALPATVKWVARLPSEIQPLALLRRYPRIANLIARSWNRAAECQHVLDDLLVDRRGGRQGFPPEVHEALMALRDYYQGRYPHLPSPRECADR